LRKFYDFWGEKAPFLLKKILCRGTLIDVKSLKADKTPKIIKKRRAKNEIS
jgi:hypothetical protein